MMPAYKKWVIAFFALLLAILLLLGSITAVLDPYFHYHAPLEGLSYELFYQRYQNDGIVKHFDYDALITGNSMTENFKTSLCDELFGTKAGAKLSPELELYSEANGYMTNTNLTLKNFLTLQEYLKLPP